MGHYGRKSVKDVSFELRAATSTLLLQLLALSASAQILALLRSLSTVVRRLHRVHASYLKWRPVSRYISLLFCKLRNPNKKDMEYTVKMYL